MAKKCPKCGDVVSDIKWHYGGKKCRRCEASYRYKKPKTKDGSQ